METPSVKIEESVVSDAEDFVRLEKSEEEECIASGWTGMMGEDEVVDNDDDGVMETLIFDLPLLVKVLLREFVLLFVLVLMLMLMLLFRLLLLLLLRSLVWIERLVDESKCFEGRSKVSPMVVDVAVVATDDDADVDADKDEDDVDVVADADADADDWEDDDRVGVDV